MLINNRLSQAMASVLLFGFSGGLFAASSEINLPQPEIALALKRDLGVSDKQLLDLVQAESAASEIEALAKNSLGDSFAGSWIEQAADGSYKHVVATTAIASGLKVKNAQLKRVQFSQRQLDDSVNQLNTLMTSMRRSSTGSSVIAVKLSDIHTWFVDVKSNRVVITAAAHALQSAYDFAAASNVEVKMLDVIASEGEPTPAANVIGGQKYGTPNSSCSIGFAVFQGGSGGTPGFTTAGHCGSTGTSVSIGSSNVGAFRSSSFPGDDMAWVNVRTSDRLFPLVDQYNGFSYSVLGNTQAVVGASVCRSGFASGLRCGTITSRNVTVNYSAGSVFDLASATACVTSGDSGGAWITPSGQAQGVTSGGNLDQSVRPYTNCRFATPQSYYQKLPEIQRTYNLSLLISR